MRLRRRMHALWRAAAAAAAQAVATHGAAAAQQLQQRQQLAGTARVALYVCREGS